MANNQIYIRGNEIATKEYVDSLSLGGENTAVTSVCPVYDFPFKDSMSFYLGTTLNTVSSTNSETLARAAEIINDMKANDFGAAIINFYNYNQANSMAYMCISQFGAVSRNSTSFTFMAFNKSGHAYTQNYEFENVRVNINGKWTDDVFTCTKVEVQGISINFENGIASKKYVDDAIAAAIAALNTTE